jgi:hypothetical protein
MSAVFYGPVWFVIFLTFTIYLRAGSVIYQRHRELRNLSGEAASGEITGRYGPVCWREGGKYVGDMGTRAYEGHRELRNLSGIESLGSDTQPDAPLVRSGTHVTNVLLYAEGIDGAVLDRAGVWARRGHCEAASGEITGRYGTRDTASYVTSAVSSPSALTHSPMPPSYARVPMSPRR